MSEEGFVMLSRGFFAHPLWADDRSFSRAEAWLDLIRTAAYREHKKLCGGVLVTIPRGSIWATERYLAERWQWSRTKVRSFLATLEKETMIERKKDQPIGLIFLCNFESYNPEKNQEKTKERPKKNQGKTKIEEGKEGEEGKDVGAGDERQQQPDGPERWIADLSADPAYTGLNVAAEFNRMVSWCKANNKQASRRRFVNWLLRADKPLFSGFVAQPQSQHTGAYIAPSSI